MALVGHRRGDTIPVGRRVAIPEDRDLRLLGAAGRAVYTADLFDFVEVSRVLIARQRRRSRWAELRRRVERPRGHVGELRPGTWQEAGRGWSPLANAHPAEKRRRRRSKAIRAAPQENVIGDLLAPLDAAGN